MKSILVNLVKSGSIVATWATILTFFGVWLFRTYSASPTFPYYYILLLQVRDAAYALWGYFDGVHYLRLIDYGYVDVGTQAFFPLYPILARFVATLTPLGSYASGVVVSLTSLTVALYLLWQLFPKQKLMHTLAILLFPTSFFWVGLYTESLFLALSLGFFLALKKQKYLLAAILASLASATRLVGIFLAISLLITLYRQRGSISRLRIFIAIILSCLGFFAYSYFLYREFGDPLMFLHVQSMFGANRSSDELVLLPQVIYRYIKMIITVDPTTFIYQRICLELVAFALACVAWWRNIRLVNPSISVYVGLSLLLPTLTGTLSSMPRYILVLVPFLLPVSIRPTRYFFLIAFSAVLMLYLLSHYAYGTFVA